MARILLHLIFAVTVIPACQNSNAPKTHRVKTDPAAFKPARIEITAGDTVEWRFGGPHNALFRDQPGRPADIPVSPEGRYARAFPDSGTFPYTCTLHPGMNGEVVVRPR